jgi:D-alanyl-D-alanine carboxypeptidase/D-alanyl-D-alanine-endopeptidase (penicillin-binding protein 4)
VICVLAAGLTLAGLGPGAAAADGDGVPPAPAPAVLQPIDVTTAAGPAPTPAGIKAAVRPLVGPTLGDESIVIMDPTSQTVLFEKQAARPRIPASTLKLATASAALTVLGPQARIPTVVYRDADTVFLVGGGDPTLVRSGGGNPLAGGSASLRTLARSVASDFTAGTAVSVVYDDSAFRGPRLGPGWPRSFPSAGVAAPVTALVVDGGRVRPGALSRVADPARQAALVFAGFLKGRGLDVTAVTKGKRGGAGSEIARVESPPVGDIVQRMLTESENNFAEAMAHLVGGKVLGQPTFAGGAAAMSAALADLGIDTGGVSFADGSGLSGQNQVPARVLASILTDVARGADPDLALIAPGLAVAGFTGTLAERFQTPATAAGRGVVHAKTGTLTGVVSLAGTVLDADGRVLVYALIANTVPSLTAARDTMDQIASRLATCGCS